MTVPRVSQPMPMTPAVREKPQSKLMAFLGDLPTTQARVLITLLAVIATTVKYVLSEAVIVGSTVVVARWEPSYEWLAWLIVMSGLDLAQFRVKRTTDSNYVNAQLGVVPDPALETARGKAP